MTFSASVLSILRGGRLSDFVDETPIEWTFTKRTKEVSGNPKPPVCASSIRDPVVRAQDLFTKTILGL